MKKKIIILLNRGDLERHSKKIYIYSELVSDNKYLIYGGRYNIL